VERSWIDLYRSIFERVLIASHTEQSLHCESATIHFMSHNLVYERGDGYRTRPTLIVCCQQSWRFDLFYTFIKLNSDWLIFNNKTFL